MAETSPAVPAVEPSTAGPSRRHWLGVRRQVAPWLLAAGAAILVLPPLLFVLVGAFRSGELNAPNTYWTLDKLEAVYGGLLRGDPILQVVLQSLWLAGLVTVLATAGGALLAWILARTNVPGRSFFGVALITPMFYTALVGLIGWTMLAEAQSGFINILWRSITGSETGLLDIYSFPGLVWVMTLNHLPLAFALNAGTFSNTDTSLEEAASVFGARPWYRFWRVLFPLSWPGLAASALFTFALALEHFVAPAFLGSHFRYETLSYSIYLKIRAYPNDPSMAASMGTLLVLLTLVGLALYRQMTKRAERFVTVTGKSRGSRRLELGRWRWPIFTVLSIVTFVVAVLPLLAVVLRSLMPFRTSELEHIELRLDNYVSLLETGNLVLSVTNSLMLGAAAATICVLVGALISYFSIRRRSRATAIADYLASMPLGVPGVVFGVGMLWAYVATDLYLTIWVMLLAFVIRYLVYGVRTASAGLMAIDTSLEESAHVSGASRLETFLRIDLPLLRSGAASAWVLVFLLTMQELSATIMLYGPKTTTLSILNWNYLEEGFYGPASAVAVCQLALVAAIVVVFRFIFKVDIRPEEKKQ